MYATELSGRFERYKANGYGYEMWLPEQPKDFSVVSLGTGETAIFSEIPEIIHKLRETSGGLLIEGEPGAGKSHIRDDLIVQKGILEGVPYLSASLHINGGRPEGPAVLPRLLRDWQRQVMEQS